MRWSTFRTPDGDEAVGVWSDGRMHVVPGETSLLTLIAEDRLDEAARSAAQPAPDGVTLLAPIPRPPAIRDFMAFEEHVVTASAAIGLTVDPALVRPARLLLHEPVVAARAARRRGGAAGERRVGLRARDRRGDRPGGPATWRPTRPPGHIAGYVLFCDWSARDLQGAEMRLNLGPAKGKDFASSCGPWMLTPDELAPAAGDVGLGQRPSVQRGAARRPLLELRPDDRLRVARHPCRARRPHRLGHRRHRLPARALPRPRRRRLPLAAGRTTASTSRPTGSARSTRASCPEPPVTPLR